MIFPISLWWFIDFYRPNDDEKSQIIAPANWNHLYKQRSLMEIWIIQIDLYVRLQR